MTATRPVSFPFADSESLRSPAAGVVILLMISLAAGGGGVSEAFGNLAVQLAALALLAIHGSPSSLSIRRSRYRLPLALALASALLPLVQLIPLPPAMWQAMPGRTLVAQSLALAGGMDWFPISVDRSRTLVAFVGLLAPLAIIVIGVKLEPGRLVAVQRATIPIAVAVALFGSFHLLGAEWADLYSGQRPMPGILVGTFADRNAAGLFFVCGLLLLAGLPKTTADWRHAAAYTVGALILLIAVVLTRSRSSIALLVLPAGLFAWRLLMASRSTLRSSGNRPARGRKLLAGLAPAVAVGVVLVLILSSGQAGKSFDRFSESDGMRAEMRADALFVARRYWPVGAGMGTFDEVFQVDESLEYLSPRKAGRAHMDFYELAIEAGLAGLALLAGWFAWATSAFLRALRQPDAWPARAAGLGLLAIAGQSVVSFPLRNQSMLCVAALLVVLLACSPALVRRQGTQP